MKMEEDCEDRLRNVSSPTAMDDISKMFAALSAQLTSQTLQILGEISQVVQNNDTFKQEVHSEFDELRSSIQDMKNPSDQTVSPGHLTPSSTTPDVSSHLPGSHPSIPPISQASVIQSHDPQSQMMSLFAASFTKFSEALSGNQQTITQLSSVLSEKTDCKAEWPKFSGDSKKFCTWHLSIMAQLLLPPWVELYDAATNDIVATTSNSTLNGKLYSKLLLALYGNALKSIVSHKHLRANGILLFKESIQTYQPKNVHEVIAFKTSEFWGNTKRFPSESVDKYYNHFHELLEDLKDGDEHISPKSAIRHFIFTLGNDLEALQNNFRLKNLPEKWNTQDWPTILILCRGYYHSIKPQGLLKKESSPSQSFDREAHQKKIKTWFMNPSKLAGN
jgi:hypothetical protein